MLNERTYEMYRLLCALFEQGQRRGEIRREADPMQLAEVLIATYHLTTINWLIGWWSERQTLQRRLSAAIEILMEGCVAHG